MTARQASWRLALLLLIVGVGVVVAVKERRSVAPLLLQSNVLLNQVQWHVPGPLDHDLHGILPGTLGQLGQGAQLCHLRRVVRVSHTPRTQSVPQAERHVILRKDLAELVEVGVEEALLVVGQTPASHDRPPRLTMPVIRQAVIGTKRSSTPAWTVM